MRVQFLQNFWTEHLGFAHIIACLKQEGHEVSLAFTRTTKEAVAAVGKSGPDLVAFTATTGIHRWCEQTNRAVKETFPGTKTIIGGAHPTFFPDHCAKAGFDFVCRNEGETTIMQLAERLEHGEKEFYDVPHLSWLNGGPGHVKNPEGHLVEDLESLPWADRSLHFQNKFLRDSPYKFFMSNRGCPYQCTFCYAPAIKERMKGKGKWNRTRDPQSLVEEILHVRDTYGLRLVDFQDDIFGLNRKWFLEFAEIYPQRVGLPFICNGRIDQMTEDNVKLFAQAGCYGVALGLEHGNEEIRNKMLDKRITNEKVREVGDRLHRHGVRFLTYNIFGLPGETWEQAWETVTLNRQIKTDWMRTSLFQPSPGTKLFDMMKDKGYLDGDTEKQYMPNAIFQDTEMVPMTTPEVANLQKLFHLFVKFPALTFLWKPLLKLKPGPLHWTVFFLTYGWSICGLRRMPMWHLAKVAYHEVNLFLHR